MDAFRSAYLAKCVELAQEPLPAVLDTLAVGRGKLAAAAPPGDGPAAQKRTLTTALDLAGRPLHLKPCTALMAAIADSCFFSSLVLADAFLGDDGCIIVANSLKTNTSITRLDLRGNGIRADGAVALGQMLKVNSAIKSLNLEWNCIGIWETGIRSIADALSVNSTLEELDLRNNKIGPHSAQALAIGMKHNTYLWKLDLRWNGVGLVGGRAFSDLLKWNMTLTELLLAGNEIPEDVQTSITVAIERNCDRNRHETYAKAHNETLTSTIQSLSFTHQEALTRLTSKLASTDERATLLSQKLSQASSEIADTQDAYRLIEAKCKRIEEEKNHLEDQITIERDQSHARVAGLMRDLSAEIERRTKAEDAQQILVAESKTRILKLESQVKHLDTEAEVLRRDKTMLLEELSKAKEKERSIVDLWEEKLQRQNASNQTKLVNLQNARDEELAERSRRYDERIRSLEVERTKTQEEVDAIRTKFQSEKLRWGEELSATIDRIHKEEVDLNASLSASMKETRRSTLEGQVQNLTQQKNATQNELAQAMQLHAQSTKERASELKQFQDERTRLQQELIDVKGRDAQHSSDISLLRKQLEGAHRQLMEMESAKSAGVLDAARTREEIERERRERREETDRMQRLLHNRDALIMKLKEDIQRRDEELDNRDEENFVKMKELQMSINSLLAQRTRKQGRIRSPEPELNISN